MPPAVRFIVGLLALGALFAAGSLWVQRQEGRAKAQAFAVAMTKGGDPEAGRAVIVREGCGACHAIPGVPRADGLVGPSLDKVAARAFLAGRLPQEPEQMQRWIHSPQAVSPGSGMPDMGLTDREARDVAAYLYTLD